MSNDFSRRTFLKGAGITALGAAAAGMLAGCGQGYQVPANEVPYDVRTTPANETIPNWLGLPPEIAESDITETVDTEVLVVGTRTGGLPAMMSAAENGAQVLGIDRTAKIAAPA